MGAYENELLDVAHVAGTSRRVWAVGRYADSDGAPRGMLAMRWNGARWIVVPTPDFGRGDDVLTGVVALSSFNIWAVGYSQSRDGTRHTLAMRWNGRRWTRFRTPSPGTGDDVLLAVAAVSPRDVWAVGYSRDRGTGPDKTLALHWNGSAWTWVRTPNLRSGGERLLGVAAIPGTRQIWAAGWADDADLDGGRELALRWTGERWRVFTAPVWEEVYVWFSDVDALSARSAWATATWSSGAIQPDVGRWNGSAWSLDGQISRLLDPEGWLGGIDAVSPREVWAVGGVDFAGETFVIRWNGDEWRRIRSPSPGTGSNWLNEVVRVPATGVVWAVGGYWNEGGPTRTLVERFC